MKSITQAAEELHISVRTLQRYIKKMDITTHRHGKERLIDDDSVQLIGSMTNAIDTTDTTDTADMKNSETTLKNTSNTTQTTQDTNDKNVTCDNCDKLKLYENKAEMLQSQLELLQSELSLLTEQLQIKDKQIESLSTALTTAQALQGIEKKQNLLVVGADAEEQPQQKRGFFARLFRKKTR